LVGAQSGQDSGAGSKKKAAGRPATCHHYRAASPEAMVGAYQDVAGLMSGPVSGGMVVGQWYRRFCTFADNGETAMSPAFRFDGGVPDTGAALEQALVRLPLAFPPFQTSPPYAAGNNLVGFPVWLWVEPGSWESAEAEADVTGVSVTVVATPDRVEWNMGDGDRSGSADVVTCFGPGTPWDAEQPNQKPTCAQVYQWDSSDQAGGVYHSTATMFWKVAWVATSGEQGTLPDAFRSQEFDIAVHSMEAVIVR
jgi:hypothetical protein